MTDKENRCEYCLRNHHPGQAIRWCSKVCASSWMREFYWPSWHIVLAKVLDQHPDADPREIGAMAKEQTLWIVGGPPPTDCGGLGQYLAMDS